MQCLGIHCGQTHIYQHRYTRMISALPHAVPWHPLWPNTHLSTQVHSHDFCSSTCSALASTVAKHTSINTGTLARFLLFHMQCLGIHCGQTHIYQHRYTRMISALPHAVPWHPLWPNTHLSTQVHSHDFCSSTCSALASTVAKHTSINTGTLARFLLFHMQCLGIHCGQTHIYQHRYTRMISALPHAVYLC